ncbi:hypothetical protein GGX14DRAFT_639472 [Mycena pura]|uniref:GST N-terminal domain-containing protein n=1 Tax=Mycena pura TaxID=153505 RepID=A0AAD6YPE5_9AGAR|nr:hypothetical protein GGX14DRAFT_639472 [Mycena pura]
MSVPKAVLYYSSNSVWSCAVLLALEEKGYADDEVDRKIVDLDKGDNFSVSFLRLNIKGTVPTLVVPFQDSLSVDAERRYKALIDPKVRSRAIINFLDQSRSPLSRTRTTSTAPAPTLTPATIAFTATTETILEIIHAEDVSPDILAFINAQDDVTLKTFATNITPAIAGRQKALAECLSDAEAGKIVASAKVKNFWREKQIETEQLLAVLLVADKEEAALESADKTRRAEFFIKAKAAWGVKVKGACVKLNQEIIGPYALGDQLSTADVSLAAWMRKVVILAGGTAGNDGATAISTLESYIGFTLAKNYQAVDAREKEVAMVSKLEAFWQAMSSRSSWKKMY